FMIWRVEDPFGRVIHEHIVQEKQVLDPAITYQVIDMMKSVIDRGSGASVRRLGFTRPTAGKTGTSDSYNDAWFIGFTPGLSTAVWTGFDKEKKLINKNGRGITGGRAAAPIWTEFMKKALKNSHRKDFPIPKDIRFVKVDSATGFDTENKESQENIDPKNTNQINTEAEIYTIALKRNQEPNLPKQNPLEEESPELIFNPPDETPDANLNSEEVNSAGINAGEENSGEEN
ncbi:MAG: hypothetical protein KAR45_17440, partial [Desulfobacteraceae bacterium]|nr:hypothetical protein [Desulfobacteraceae bacterium]